MDEPTIGVDVGAKEEIRKIIDEIAARGRRRSPGHDRARRAGSAVRPRAGDVSGRHHRRALGRARSIAKPFCAPRPAARSRRWRRDDALGSPNPARAAAASRLLASLKRSYSLIQALGVLAILIVVMQIANDRFLSPANVGNLLGQMTVMLIVARRHDHRHDRRRIRRFGRLGRRIVGRGGRLDHGPMDPGAERRRSSLVGDRARA